jgi:hypothetical protein
MLEAEFERTTPLFDLAKTSHALDSAANLIDKEGYIPWNYE